MNPATGVDITSIYMILGLIVGILALCLLIVFFLSPKAFPRKEFLGAVVPLVKKYFWTFTVIVIIQQLLINAPSFFSDVYQVANKLPENEPISMLISFVVTMIISIILQAGLVRIALSVMAGEAPRISGLFSQTRVFLKYLCATILYGFIVFGGFLLLIVPGVIWLLKFSLWPYFVVEKNAGPIEALKMSSRATAGYKESLLTLSLYIFALNILGAAALLVGLFVTIPITFLTYAYVYRKLTGETSAVSAPPIA